MKKILCVVLSLAAVLSLLAGCGKKESSDSENSADAVALNKSTDAYKDEEFGFQLEDPEEGEEVAVLHTSAGDIYMRFFEKAAPKTVENFKTHIKEGYYNGLIFHRVIADFMIQGGDPNGTGTGGESIWGEPFEDEFDKKLVNITGAVAMANSGVNTNGSQFFINCPGTKETKDKYKNWQEYKDYYISNFETYKNQFKEQYASKYPNWEDMFNSSYYVNNGSPVFSEIPDELWKLYYEQGANFHLDGAYRASGGHTVFAQVYKGLDVVEAIEKVETDDNDKPKTDVVITSAEIIKYSK